MEEKTYGNILDVLREFAPESIDRFRDLATSDIRGIEDKIVHETSRELGAIEVSNPRVRELIQDLGIDGYQAEFTALRDAFAEEAAAGAHVVDTDTEQFDSDDIGPDEDTEYHPALSYDGYDPEDFAPMEEPVRQNSSIPPSEEIENLSTFETPVAKDDAPKAVPAAQEDTERPQPAASDAGQTIRDLGREISGGTPNPFDHIARDTKFDAIVTTGNALLGLNRFTKQDLVREYGKIDGSRIYDDSMAKIQAAMSDARDGKISTRDFIDRFKEAYETAYETKSTRDEVIKDFRKELDSAVHAKDPVSRGEHMGNAYRNFVENRAYFKEALVEKGARESDAEKTMDRLERVFESAFDRGGSDASAGENLTDFSNQYAYAFNGTKGMPETARPDVPADRQQYLDRAEFWSHQGEKFVRYRSDLFSNASRLGESYNRMKAASGGVEKGVAVAGFVGDVARFLQSNALETVVLELVKVVVTYLSGAEVEKDIEKMIREYEPDIDRTDVPEADAEPMEKLEQDPDKTELPDPEIPGHDETEKREDSADKPEDERDPDGHDHAEVPEEDPDDTERLEDPDRSDHAEEEKDPAARPEEALDPTEKPEGDGVETAEDPAEQSEVEHTPEGEAVPESGAPDKSEDDLPDADVETAEEHETEADPVDADPEPDDAAASAVSKHGAEHAEEDRFDKSDVREAFASQKASGEDTEDEGNGVTVEEAVNAGEPTTDKNERGEPSVEREDDISDDRLTGMLDDYVAGDISAVDMMDLLGGNMRIEEAVMRLVGAEGGVENLTMERMDQLTDLLAEANEYTNGDTLRGLTTIANENPGLGWDIEQLQNGMIGKSWVDFDNHDTPMDIELGGATFVADETGLTGVSGSESFTGIEYVADPVEASMNDVVRDRVGDVAFDAPDPVEIPEHHDVDIYNADKATMSDPPAVDNEPRYNADIGAENVYAGGADMEEAVEAAAVIL